MNKYQNLSNVLVDHFRKQGLSGDSLVTESELITAIQRQSNIDYDKDIFE